MKCPNCNREIVDNAKFCSYCGEKTNINNFYVLGETALNNFNLEVAFKNFMIAAKQGDSNAQYALGMLYDEYHYGYHYEGKGILDKKDAIYWYKQSAEQGNAKAQNALGIICFSYDENTKKNYTLAFDYFRKSAEQGNSNAQNNLGECYMFGKGVLQDYKKAFEWYAKAAEQGNLYAQKNLGDLYFFGKGIPKDLKLAYKWYKKSAAQGSIDAQFKIDILCEIDSVIN